ncbi:C-C chemokine receptor type 6 [Oryzias melastigma]|uniref:C-C chemokine receptor type 6 n=1 Tax=Oryzias melastigma TaxID=30732 RepID=A0A3B3CKG7_ORYME|nr:C-C chemokine receptor type 6 [Oryzias melastigma]KAF6719456.1 C-C chemokine receptor type 6 [Oryzias melastigma]
MENETFNYESTNDSEELCDLGTVQAEAVTQTTLHAIICVFGLIGNLLVMITYFFYKRSKTMTDVYLFNLAVADLIFVIVLPLIILNEQAGWSMGIVACKMLESAYSINLFSSTLLLACISADRYVAIVHARRSFGSRSHALTYSRLICSTIWASALALTLPTLIFTELFEESDPITGTSNMKCQLSFNKPHTAKLMKVLVPGLQMAIGFLVPVLVMGFCYSCIAYSLLRAQRTQRHKAIKVIVAVVVAFLLCHLPYNVTLLIHTMSLFKERSCEVEKTKLYVLNVSKSVAYLHCCLNPILYAFVGVKFRSHFMEISSDIWCFSKKHIYSARSSRGASDLCTSGLKSSDVSHNMSSFSA